MRHQMVSMKSCFAAWLLVSIATSCYCQQRPSQDAFVVKAKTVAQEALVDPESVRFRGLFISIGLQTQVLCGELNAKNGYGGYVGFRRFIADERAMIRLEDLDHSALMDLEWKYQCSDKRADIK